MTLKADETELRGSWFLRSGRRVPEKLTRRATEARRWAAELPLLYFNLEEIQQWEDERVRIRNGDLDYGRIISDHLARLQRVRAAFRSMDENTY